MAEIHRKSDLINLMECFFKLKTDGVDTTCILRWGRANRDQYHMRSALLHCSVLVHLNFFLIITTTELAVIQRYFSPTTIQRTVGRKMYLFVYAVQLHQQLKGERDRLS